MESIKNLILILLQKNLFLSPEQREQIRVWCSDTKKLESHGKRIIDFLQTLNEKEAVIFRDILKHDPYFFKNIERKFQQEKRTIVVKREYGIHQQEISDVENFLEEEFYKITSS
jgi:hypothetical protein